MFDKFMDCICDKIAERVANQIDAKCVQIIVNAERDARRIGAEAAAEVDRILTAAEECAPLVVCN